MFKRGPSLVKQVKTHLKQLISRLEFENGRIPPEAELARELGVSRNTLRDALSQLEAEGFVIRRQGAGTFVNRAGLMVKTRLDEIIPYQDLIEEYGYLPTVKLLSVEEEPAQPALADALDVAVGSPVVVAKKLFLADETPVIFSTTHIPQKFLQRPYSHDDLRGPIYYALPQLCERTFAYYLTEVKPVLAPDWLVDILQLPQEKAVLLAFDETGYCQDDWPAFKSCSYFRDDLIRLRMIRRLTH